MMRQIMVQTESVFKILNSYSLTYSVGHYVVKMALPAVIEPCLPSPGEQPPTGPGWLHEIKHDGYRLMAQRDGGGQPFRTVGSLSFCQGGSTMRFLLLFLVVMCSPGFAAAEQEARRQLEACCFSNHS